jgi:hypothetical protein
MDSRGPQGWPVAGVEQERRDERGFAAMTLTLVPKRACKAIEWFARDTAKLIPMKDRTEPNSRMRGMPFNNIIARGAYVHRRRREGALFREIAKEIGVSLETTYTAEARYLRSLRRPIYDFEKVWRQVVRVCEAIVCGYCPSKMAPRVEDGFTVCNECGGSWPI